MERGSIRFLNRNKRFTPFIMLLPVLSLILGVFILGLIVGLLQSFGYIPVIGKTDFTLDYYRNVFSNPGLLRSLQFSFTTSFISSSLSVLFGMIITLFLLGNEKDSLSHKMIYRIPIAVPHTVAALIIYTMFSQSGFLSRLLFHTGIIESTTEAPFLIFDKKGIGIIIAYLWKSAPFVAVVCHSSLEKINFKMVRTAHTLGAGKIQVFFHILLPLLKPTLLSAFIIIFAYSFSSLEIPYLLGPSTPQTLPELAYSFYGSLNLEDRSNAMVVNVLITLITMFLVWLYSLNINSLMGRKS